MGKLLTDMTESYCSDFESVLHLYVRVYQLQRVSHSFTMTWRGTKTLTDFLDFWVKIL